MIATITQTIISSVEKTEKAIVSTIDQVSIQVAIIGTGFTVSGSGGGGGGGNTNLSTTYSATDFIISSDTGNDATINAADGSYAGAMTSAMFTKLSGIYSGATVNQTDAYLLSRANHTGTQAQSTVLNLTADLAAKINSSLIGVANGIAPLDSGALISSAYLPSYVDDVLEFANLAVFPATGSTGKIYVALDTNKTYRWSGSIYVFITSGAVDSVAGKTGIITLVKADVGLSNVDNTSDSNKPVSTAQQSALDLKANLNSPTFTGTVGGISKSMVGLGNVDNTADSAKPVSTAHQNALDLKANLNNPTFTGVVGGLTKAMVGLGSVDNTSDASKPVSTAQQTALNLKANLSSPIFTGTVGGLDKTTVGLSNVDNTSDANKPVSAAQATAIDSKQDELISGDNIKTINGQSVLGSGNIVISGGGGSSVEIFEATLTASSVKYDSFTQSVSVAGVLQSSRACAWIMPNAEFDADDLIGISVFAVPKVDSIDFTIASSGPIVGTYTIYYMVI